MDSARETYAHKIASNFSVPLLVQGLCSTTMAKKFGIRKLVRIASSPKLLHKNSKDNEQQVISDRERWEAFESKLAQRMAGKQSPGPNLLNETGSTERSEESSIRNLVAPSKVSGRSEKREDLVGHVTSDGAPSPEHKPVLEQLSTSPEEKDPEDDEKEEERNRANSCDSFSSGRVRIVHTSDSEGKATVKTKPRRLPNGSRRYKYRGELEKSLESLRSGESSTDSCGSSIDSGYSSGGEDSFTFATKETAYTFRTISDDSTVGLAERFVVRLASMFLCDFRGDGQSCRRQSIDM